MTTEQVKELVERLRSRKRVVAIGEDKHDAAKYTAQMAEDDGAAISALTLLAQERDGYRLALRRIADHNNAFLTDGSEATRKCIDHVVEIARAALKDT